MSHHPLVSTTWLADNLAKPNLVIFDTTKYLPNEPKDGLTEFRKAHIPGARFFDIDAIADADTDLPHMVPAPGRFAKLVGALGGAKIFSRRNAWACLRDGGMRPACAGLSRPTRARRTPRGGDFLKMRIPAPGVGRLFCFSMKTMSKLVEC